MNKSITDTLYSTCFTDFQSQMVQISKSFKNSIYNSSFEDIFKKYKNFNITMSTFSPSLFSAIDKIQKSMLGVNKDFYISIDKFSSLSYKSVLPQIYEQVLKDITYEDFFEKEKVIDETQKEEIKKVKEIVLNQEQKKVLSPIQQYFFATYLYPLICGLFFYFLGAFTAKPSIIKNYNYSPKYYTQIVNNHYTIELGYDAELLNKSDLRIIIEKNAEVRLFPDTHSEIVGIATIGQIVKILEKHRKWIKISWTDENKNKIIGWIQNWRLSKFKD